MVIEEKNQPRVLLKNCKKLTEHDYYFLIIYVKVEKKVILVYLIKRGFKLVSINIIVVISVFNTVLIVFIIFHIPCEIIV